MNIRFIILLLFFGITNLIGQCFDPEIHLKYREQIQNDHRINTVFPGYSALDISFSSAEHVFDSQDSILFEVRGVKGLWISGLDANANLHVAATTWLHGGNSDYTFGPAITYSDPLFDEKCAFYNRVWIIRQADILRIKSLFESGNLQIEDIPEDILEWPALNNPWLGELAPTNHVTGMAPFHDIDNDNIYDPLKGDYPIALDENHDFIPYEMSFIVYNDNVIHTESQSRDFPIEIHQINYVIQCEENEEIEKAVFTRLKYINKGPLIFNNIQFGLWEYNSIGCQNNEYHGCDTLLNCTYTYNKNGNDENGTPCQNTSKFTGDLGVVRSNIYLNSTLESHIYTVPDHIINAEPKQSEPIIAEHYHNYLSGNWRDGSPLTQGGLGTDTTSSSTKFAFSDLPNDPDGWSMQNVSPDLLTYRTVTTFFKGNLNPGGVISIDKADYILYDSAYKKLDIFEIFPEKVNEVVDSYHSLVNGGLPSCEGNLNSISDNELNDNDLTLDLFPNPSDNSISLKLTKRFTGDVSIFNVQGIKIMQKSIHQNSHIDIDIVDYTPGIYFIQLKNNNGNYTSTKFIKSTY